MQKRLLYGITWPAGILTIIFGTWILLQHRTDLLKEPWFHLKLLLVGILVLYHLQCQLIFKQQSRGVYKFTSMKLRLFNEVATIVLFGVVFLVEVQRNTNWVYAILGTFALMALIFFATLIYKKQRLKKENTAGNGHKPNTGS
jgi:putative membrane protein